MNFSQRTHRLVQAIAVVLSLAVPTMMAISSADARVGCGGSIGSRGSRTFSAPPTTQTAPRSAQPFNRTITQPGTTGMGTAATGGLFNRSGLLGGLAAGFLGAAGAAALPLGADDPRLLAVILFVWGGIAGTLYTVVLAHLGARFDGAALAGANAACLVLYNIGLVLWPPLVGGGMDLASPHGFAWSLALLFVAYLAVVGGRMIRAAP